MEPSHQIRHNPYRFFLIFLMAGISMLFLLLSLAYSFSTFGRLKGFTLPIIFHANTVIILVSSFVFRQALQNIQSENHKAVFNQLLITFLLGSAFLIFQVLGWRELLQDGNGLSQSLIGDYITAISFVHLVHIIGGLLPLSYCLYKAWFRRHDAIKQLLFYTDHHALFRIRLLEFYWHFIDGLWIYVYLLFIIGLYVML